MSFKKVIILTGILLSTIFWSGCGEIENGGESDSRKPQARGGIGEILLVIDSAKYQGPVGDALKGIFEEDIKGLVREEKIFNLKRVDPRAMNRVLRMVPNIVYVTSFDDENPGSRTINAQFNQSSKEKAENDSSLFMLRNQNEFALGQEVLYLFGANEEQLIQNLEANKNKLQNFFEARERRRLERGLLSRKSSTIKKLGLEKFGIGINVPVSYQLVMEEDDFLWVRQPTPSPTRPDISLFFYETDYVSEEQLFPENIKQLRNQITRNRIFGDPANKKSFVEIQEQLVPSFRNFTIEDNYAVELRGQWRTNNLSMGGSFLSYAVIDEESGKLYYMDGFVYYPSEAHRTSLREIETILLATEFSPSQPVAEE